MDATRTGADCEFPGAAERRAEFFRVLDAPEFRKYRGYLGATKDRAYSVYKQFSTIANTNARRAKLRGDGEGNVTPVFLLCLYIHQQGACIYCDELMRYYWTIDHLWPVSKGGSNLPRNIVLACRSCNSAKSDRV